MIMTAGSRVEPGTSALPQLPGLVLDRLHRHRDAGLRYIPQGRDLLAPDTARFRDGVCVFAQVDKQGSKEANIRVADGRADAVRRFLISKGVPAGAIKIGKQEEAFTLFGLLKEDQDDDRRVFVTFN